jgi:hypothetical protein
VPQPRFESWGSRKFKAAWTNLPGFLYVITASYECEINFWLTNVWLTGGCVLPGGSGYTIKHNKQITHITENNTTIKRNTAHKTTHTIKDTLHICAPYETRSWCKLHCVSSDMFYFRGIVNCSVLFVWISSNVVFYFLGCHQYSVSFPWISSNVTFIPLNSIRCNVLFPWISWNVVARQDLFSVLYGILNYVD